MRWRSLAAIALSAAFAGGIATGDHAKAAREFERLKSAAKLGGSIGLEVHAGHGLDFETAEAIAAIPELAELNIGHFLIGEAIFTGLEAAVLRMREAMDRGRAAAAQ